ncbi:hypothetical protein MLD38_000333 [Melastoma candidum]|uniref:Uncharacterized protein n=1 Tax=Melastoma candidum TaxID=119954 RepID=A0ACB9SAP4_9MYRT|nr:hypothetical protein MLD38_000333 [Melastoma candidum]
MAAICLGVLDVCVVKERRTAGVLGMIGWTSVLPLRWRSGRIPRSLRDTEGRPSLGEETVVGSLEREAMALRIPNCFECSIMDGVIG